MSESDSFIHEVSEEVRRDKLYAFFKRYGWAIGAAVLLIVGGAGANEWRKAMAQSAAEASGETLSAALLIPDPVERAARLGEVGTDEHATRILAQLAQAGSLLDAGDRAGAGQALAAIADAPETPEMYRALAALQRVMVLGPEMDLAERRATVQNLAEDGAPFRLLALEQRAIISLELDDPAAARVDLETIMTDPGATPQLAARARQLIVATGGVLPEGISPATPADG